MIKANELRIGNYIQHQPYPDERWLVDMRLLESIDLELVECIGIPLTPEILEKCGFIKNNLEYWEKETKSNENDLDLEEVNCKFIPVINNEYSVGIEIKYLHQLQNKYFDWYGEELEIKL